MEKGEKILHDVSTRLSRVNGEILTDLYARHSLSRRRIVKYLVSLRAAAAELEKLLK